MAVFLSIVAAGFVLWLFLTKGGRGFLGWVVVFAAVLFGLVVLLNSGNPPEKPQPPPGSSSPTQSTSKPPKIKQQPHLAPQSSIAEREWIAVSAGQLHTLALRKDGSLLAIGYKFTGSAGTGDNAGHDRLTPVGTATNWTAIAAGQDHSLALRKDGTLWAWGGNQSGKLGVYDTNLSRCELSGGGSQMSISCALSPVQVGTDFNWAAIAAGDSHSLALRSDGTLWAWGGNGFGELGLGNIPPVDYCGTFMMVGASRLGLSYCAPSPMQVGTDT